MYMMMSLKLLIILLFSPFQLPSVVWSLCPARCICNDEKLVVLCKGAHLNVVPITLNPELKELSLSHNQIKSIMSSFSVYHDLEFLDISQNSLTSLGRKNFALQKHLRVMLMGSNQLTELNNQTFYGLSSLQQLDLNDNSLEQVPHRVFAGLNRLEKLDLSRNGISSVAQEAFAGLINLKTLSVRNNKLTMIPTQSFAHLPNLIKLDIGVNFFEEIPEFAFSPLTSVEDLSVDECFISTVQQSSFEHLHNLKRLQIQGNDLREIPTDAMEDLKNLHELILSKNKIKIIEAFAFRGMTKLKTLVLSSLTLLEQIDRDAFLENPNLERVAIEFNTNLRHIQSGVFDVQMATLKYLSLRANQIDYLNPRMVQWEQLEYLDIRGNPFTCNCSILWLWKYLSQSNFTTKEYSQNVLCNDPPVLRGHPLLTVPSSEFSCYENKNPQIITGTVIVAIICAILCIVVALTCRTKFTFFMNRKKYDPSLFPSLTDDLTYEKGRIIDNQIICSPATAIMIQTPIKIAPITEL